MLQLPAGLTQPLLTRGRLQNAAERRPPASIRLGILSCHPRGASWDYWAPFLWLTLDSFPNPSVILQSSEAVLAGRVTALHLLLAGGHWSNLHKIPQMPAWNLCGIYATLCRLETKDVLTFMFNP